MIVTSDPIQPIHGPTPTDQNTQSTALPPVASVPWDGAEVEVVGLEITAWEEEQMQGAAVCAKVTEVGARTAERAERMAAISIIVAAIAAIALSRRARRSSSSSAFYARTVVKTGRKPWAWQMVGPVVEMAVVAATTKTSSPGSKPKRPSTAKSSDSKR